MIFVTGCARSGTTLITRMLEACGADLGNCGGLAEHMPFKNRVLKPYLRKNGADCMGQSPLPDWENLLPYPELYGDTMRYAGDADVIKDVKTVLIWPRMVEAFPDAKWLIVYRHPDKIAESCMRTKFMMKLHSHEAWKEWAEHYHSCCDELRKVADTRTVVTSEVIADVTALKEAVEWLGFEFDAKKVKKCIRKDKWHGDKTE